ncbi:uncharacterized protein PV07_11106 [Cladophialophora immunda]|uniref:AAA+ ATPase domain-containing protein n=1 Tax=Cladophialophora immunda TaxID=569365 RepID=A0A0D2BUW6_9EURO|nr:uncharacterized protein PV07_11106 [Cladophialophora immunda]KIW22853.1 hypothetical protein PV07_11106 [Cladophialophora immunda]
MDSPVVPDASLVEELVKACGCKEDMAVALLQRCNNEVERAIRQHALRNRYLRMGRPVRSPPRTPTVSETASSAETSSLPPLPEPPTDTTVSGGDAAPRHEPAALATAPTLNVHVPKNTEFGGDCWSYSPEPVSPGGEASDLQLLGAAPDGSKQRFTVHGRHNLDVSEVPDQASTLAEWDFVLPRIPYTMPPNRELDSTGEIINIREVVGAVQHGAKVQMVRNYLERYGREKVRRVINDEVEGFAAIFYIAASNDESLLRLWIEYGGDPEAKHTPSNTPLLAFTIVNSEGIQSDTTPITSTLLSLGASPSVIPSAFYTPYLEDLSEDGGEGLDKQGNGETSVARDPDVTQWCTGAARTRLVKSLTLSQRYFLEKASKTRRPSQRQIQLAQRRNAEPLLGLPYLLIGQTLASNLLLQKLLSHLISPSKRPLVLVFAGPSGHGKTELARKLGHLLSLELEVVDCTIYNREIELFGPREPYVGSEKGSPLNNFLARNAGKRCIVFLDEFEKTSSDIHNTLLLPFQNGEYQDRRDRSMVNCSNTIWILATNAHDAIIQAFCSANHQVLFGDDDDSAKMRLAKPLSAEIKEDFLSKFGSPITGRISAFIPFLRFSPGEQAVVAHKYLLELGYGVEAPVNLSFGAREKLLGDVRVRIRNDASVCRLLAKAEYHPELGARSLDNAVDTIKGLLVEAYLEIDQQIKESANKSIFQVEVQADEIVVRLIGRA